METPTPIALRPGDKANFETLKRAHREGRLALVSAVRKSDGAPVALVAAIGDDPDTGEYVVSPLAVMVEGNPFEDFHDPTA